MASFLCQHDIEAIALHGDLDQRERDQVLLQFANGSCPVLVASDVAARGWIFPRLRWLSMSICRAMQTPMFIGLGGRAERGEGEGIQFGNTCRHTPIASY